MTKEIRNPNDEGRPDSAWPVSFPAIRHSCFVICHWSFSLLLSAWRKVWSAELQLCAFGSHTAPRGGVTGGGLRQGRRGALPFPLPGEEAGMRVVLPAVFLALFSAVATVFASGPTNQTDKATA